jgi:hypothetical protein
LGRQSGHLLLPSYIMASSQLCRLFFIAHFASLQEIRVFIQRCTHGNVARYALFVLQIWKGKKRHYVIDHSISFQRNFYIPLVKTREELEYSSVLEGRLKLGARSFKIFWVFRGGEYKIIHKSISFWTEIKSYELDYHYRLINVGQCSHYNRDEEAEMLILIIKKWLSEPSKYQVKKKVQSNPIKLSDAFCEVFIFTSREITNCSFII